MCVCIVHCICIWITCSVATSYRFFWIGGGSCRFLQTKDWNPPLFSSKCWTCIFAMAICICYALASYDHIIEDFMIRWKGFSALWHLLQDSLLWAWVVVLNLEACYLCCKCSEEWQGSRAACLMWHLCRAEEPGLLRHDPVAFLRTLRGGRLRWEECQQLPWVSFAPFSLPRGAVSTFRTCCFSSLREDTALRVF